MKRRGLASSSKKKKSTKKKSTRSSRKKTARSPARSSRRSSTKRSASKRRGAPTSPAAPLFVTDNDEQFVGEVSLEFLYQPHTLTAIVAALLSICYFAVQAGHAEMQGADQLTINRVSLTAICVFTLVLGSLVFPRGPFIRPHPVFWRLVFAVSFLYELWLIFILSQPTEAARRSLQIFDRAQIGTPLAEKSYAEDCTLNWANFSNNLFDRFFLSHFFGWVCKAIMIRDFGLSWFMSITWELVEIGFMHMLPNYAECWWDSWVLDVGISNALGIFVGMRIVKWLEMREYNFTPVREPRAIVKVAKRFAWQFTPASWGKVRWRPLHSVKRFAAAQVIVVLAHIFENNSFFLKTVLNVAESSKLNVFRLLIWWGLALPCWRQMYTYMSDPRCKRMGNHTFLGACVLLTELCVIIKHGRGMFTEPMAPPVRRLFIGLGTLYVIGCVGLMMRISRSGGGDSDDDDEDEEGVEATAPHELAGDASE